MRHFLIDNAITLPSEIFIKNRIWTITLLKPLIMTIVCEHNKKERYEIKPYFQVVKLKHNCYAFSDVISLPAYIQGHSEVKIQHSYSSLITMFNQNLTLPIWQNIKVRGPFVQTLCIEKDTFNV